MAQKDDLHARCEALRHRSAQLRANAAAIRYTSVRLQYHVVALGAPATGGAIYDVPATDPHAVAMEALQMIRAVLDTFPLEWQIAIVKALTAHTLIKAKERTRPVQPALSA